MEKTNSEIFEEAKNEENPLKLLGKKTIRFSVEKESENNKKLSSAKTLEENQNDGRWSYSEQIQFIEAISKDGTNWKKIKETITTRSLPQIRSHAQKFFKRLKRCKNKELGIDFTSNKIRSIKDMINHIKSVNINYDVNNIFLYLTDNKRNFEEIKKNEFCNINNQNIISPLFIKDKYNLDLNILNSALLLDSLNNINNSLNSFIFNYLSKSIITNNLINQLYNNYLENINKSLNKVEQASIINSPNALNNSNNDEIKDNINNI